MPRSCSAFVERVKALQGLSFFKLKKKRKSRPDGWLGVLTNDPNPYQGRALQLLLQRPVPIAEASAALESERGVLGTACALKVWLER
eukprot:g29939.t1